MKDSKMGYSFSFCKFTQLQEIVLSNHWPRLIRDRKEKQDYVTFLAKGLEASVDTETTTGASLRQVERARYSVLIDGLLSEPRNPPHPQRVVLIMSVS